MDLKNKIATNKFFAVNGFIFFCLTILLGLAVCVQATVIYRAVLNTQVRVIPVGINKPFDLSANDLDVTEIDAFTRLFVSMRFDLIPNTVEHNFALIETYMSSQYYETIKQQLEKEASYIKSRHVTTSFHITNIDAYPQHKASVISGLLSRSESGENIDQIKKKYLLQFGYHNGHIQIINFKDVTNEKDISL